MTDRKSVSYTFEKLEDAQQFNQTVVDIVVEDTGAKHWRSTRSMPPTCFPPPLTSDAIAKLKDLKGVVVEDIAKE